MSIKKLLNFLLLEQLSGIFIQEIFVFDRRIELKFENIKNSKKLGLALRIIAAVIIIAVIILKYDELKNIDVRAIVDSSANLAVAAASILGVYLIKSLTFVVPASIVYIAVGMAFDPLTAVLINICGIFLEVTVTYVAGVFLGGNYVLAKLENTKYGEKLLKMQSKNKISALIAIRFLPVFPIDIVSLLLGAMKTNYLQYIFVSLVGILPRVILFTLLGDGIYDYIPMDKLMMIAVVAVPAALIAWIVRYAVKKKK